MEDQSGYANMIAWIVARIRLPGYSPSLWNEEHDEKAIVFLSTHGECRLFACIADDKTLELCCDKAPSQKRLYYFVSSSPSEAQKLEKLTFANISTKVQHGSLAGGANMSSLLRSMKGLYAAQIFDSQVTWPESVKKDFTGHFHRFMASLTETANMDCGKTVLYLPSPKVIGDEAPAVAAKNKDLAQQLESIVIHWTRQIKEVVNSHDNAYHAKVAGPLEEIQFWRSRTVDLSGISEQLQQPDVRRVVAVLEASKSSYLARFESLVKKIQDNSIEATDNLKFLEHLLGPCESLARSDPKEICHILPELLASIRMIWTLSGFYNHSHPERLTGLLRKISNEIIHRCCAKISLEEIFDGDVEGSMVALDESIQCGVLWKRIYRKTAAAIKVAASAPLVDGKKRRQLHCWNFDDASIFAQIDAFVQRCRDLLEVCEGQMQFCRKSAETRGQPGPLPRFGGTRGHEITKALIEIQEQFEIQIQRLRGLDYQILDVKTSHWHDDYNVFKNSVKDLEVMYTNVMNTAFEAVTRTSEAVATLEIFYSLAKRDAIQRCVEKKTVDAYMLFVRTVEDVRRDFDENRRAPPLRNNEPRWAGSALWAKSNASLVAEAWTMLKSATYLVRTREYEEAEQAYNVLMGVLNDYKASLYKGWVNSLDALDSAQLQARLEQPLMRRTDQNANLGANMAPQQQKPAASPGGASQGVTVLPAHLNAPVPTNKNSALLLECNFDRGLLAMFTEVQYWEKFQGEFSIPYVAHDICNQREKLRVMREHVMLVVRAYNAILYDLTTEERRLFSDHIRKLDKRINQGLVKLSWATKGVVEHYVKDCCTHCAEIHTLVKRFKAGKQHISKEYRATASMLLLRIDKNAIYDEGVFEAKQASHRTEVKRRFQASHAAIKADLKEMFANFRDGSSEVQREWRELVRGVDREVETALRHTVKRSLQELSRAINGDAKSDPQTLFGVKIVLENSRIDYKPTMINLTHVVNIVAKELISTVAAVPRLREVLNNPQAHSTAESSSELPAQAQTEKFPSFYSVISNDEDMLKIVVQIMNGMSSTATELQKYLGYWEKYKPMWEMDKEAYVRRYAKMNRSLKNYHDDVSKYRDQQSEIQVENMMHMINFVQLDCTLLKANLVAHCQQWQQKLLGLLNNNARQGLDYLHGLFESSSNKLRTPPLNLEELSKKIKAMQELQGDCPEILAKIQPVEDQYATLLKFDVAVAPAEMQRLTSTRTAWTDFNEMLVESQRSLERSKVSMKRDLEQGLESYNNYVKELRERQIVEMPVAADLSPAQAFEIIEAFKLRLLAVQDKKSSLKSGLEIFKIESPDHKELRETEHDLELAEAIWTLTREWAEKFDEWKMGRFEGLDVAEMENAAAQFNKRLGKLGRELKRWGVWETMKTKLSEFLQTMPLIQDLKNPALRPRHWAALKKEVHRTFDESSPQFTLEAVFSLGLNAVPEFIAELSTNANKELAIEISLADIEKRWASVEMEIQSYKDDSYYKIKSTDDLFQTLEDDAVSLSTMKASKFYSSFKNRVDLWETNLARVSEVIEILLTVQRKWIYLESIFMASDDICKQLPRESQLFVEVNDTFTQIMTSCFNNPNAVQQCLTAGMLERASEMDEKLEAIQKSLDQYLETKRNVFPRFYFVSDDDLLDILGQSREPLMVQKHIKKCFEGFGAMEVLAPGKALNRNWEACGMTEPSTGETCAFLQNVVLDGAVENWLVELERAMINSMQKLLAASIQSFKGKKEKWVTDVQGQLLITTGAIAWTTDCTKALNAIATGSSKAAMKTLKKKQVSYLNRLTEMIRGQLPRLVRTKLVALITMEIHNRDVMERMIKAGCSSVTDFDWLSQLRFLFNKDEGHNGGIVSVRQTNCVLEYGYEYQGNNGRLVVTPLTDRCVLTLLTAKFLNRGGNPLGPAGTGKTETVKDLSKNLAMYCVVINCSDGMDYKSVGRIFSGLCQAGAWGCFDEFNRIKIEVISVVAMQVLSIVDALSRKAATFDFMGSEIRCNPNCGLFITMNPGYAGRTELPDNLKALMRPVAMMVPDLAMIAEVMLSAEGFTEARVLSKKTITLYSLMQQQLSKQDHYDYGLRNLKAVLNMAGAIKRSEAGTAEEAILMRALRDMNLPKFIKDDERLFRLLLSDLFPSLELPVSEMGLLGEALEEELLSQGLQCHPFLLFKIGQLFDSKLTRHCNMLVGKTMSGKSTAWKTLAKAKGRLAKKGVEGYTPVSSFVINSKSVTLTELYGAYDLATFEWADGILSTIFKSCAESEKKEEAWIMFDGPVDAMWIESMNSVMDDNKILTLINGDRIPLTPLMSLLFEVEDLRVASPATVSRAGMIFVDASEMGLEPFINSWLDKTFAKSAEARALHRALYDKYVPALLAFKALPANSCGEPVPTEDFNALQSLTRLYEAIYNAPENKALLDSVLSSSPLSTVPVGAKAPEGEEAAPVVTPAAPPTAATGEAGVLAIGGDNATYPALVEKWFAFACTWSVCAAVDEQGRKKMDVCLRDIEAQYPPTKTIYDYFVDPNKGEFELWETIMPNWRPRKNEAFFNMIVPTTDTVRNSYVFNAVTRASHNLLVVGNTGVGKTSQVQSLLAAMDRAKYANLTINFSAMTESGVLQGIIEGSMEKRSKDKLGPPGGKQLCLFIDDFNMPQKTCSESPFQPPLELLRLWMDYGGWYDRVKCAWRYVQDTQLISAMAPPSGGRAVICNRTQARFHLVNATTPDDSQLTRIFESILTPKLADFDNEIKPMGRPLAVATIAVYQSVIARFLPTPVKSHYLFNLRDVAKVVQGTLQAERQRFDTAQSVLRLWAHECFRVFSDRFVADEANDFADFAKIVESKMKDHFEKGGDWSEVMAEVDDPSYGPIFCSFMCEEEDDNTSDNPVQAPAKLAYEEVVDFKVLKQKCEEKLEDYNIEPKLINMDLVLFKDAVRHMCRVHRVLMMPRGNMMLVGVGGSGRQSLARLSAYIAGHAFFAIEITKQYRSTEWHEDMKKLFDLTGVQNRPTMFLFNDTQIKQESFVEDINNVLSSGEIPNLYAKDELGAIYDGVRKRASALVRNDGETSQEEEGTPAQLWKFFVETLRSNLHVVLCMSPVGASLRTRCRYYPGLINSTTIDWFHRWPADALTAVGNASLMGSSVIDNEEARRKVSEVFSVIHQSSISASDQMLLELKRHNYITPTHFLELVKGYKQMLQEKTVEVGDARGKLANGLAKLVEARDGVAVMSVELEKKKIVCAQSQKDCENLLVEIVSERRVADEQRKGVEADSERIGKEAIECEAIQQDAEADLMVALPALNKAMSEVDKLDKSSISEVKAYKAPPKAVETCLAAVMILFNQKTDWNTAKKVLGESNFLATVKSYNKDAVPASVMKKVKVYIAMPDFTPEAVGAVSKAAGALCTWVHAIFMYANVAKDVAPKRAMLKSAQDTLLGKQTALKKAQDELAVVTAKVQALKEKYDDSVGEKNRLRAEADQMQTLLERAAKLVTGLAGENERWQHSIGVFSAEITKCLGSCLASAAFLSYAGPFDTLYRTKLVAGWVLAIKERQLPFSENFAFASYCSKPTDVRAWNIQGLPADDFSTENGVITVRCSRWPLMIDPQGQANKWVRKMEGDQLRIVDLKSKDLLKTVENGIVYGMPVLLQDILEELDPALEPVLAKSIIKTGNRETLRLGDKELDYSHDFKLYITTKLGNPHYAPEVSTKTTIINFAVKQQGLEAQLLGIVVQKEQPSLEKQSSDLTLKVATGKKKLVELEDEILRLLSETKGSLLDDESLVDTLQQSKVTSDEVTRQLKEAEETKLRIDAKREEFRPAAIRSSIAYFVLDDMSRVDPMYQFSLDAYVDLFNQSMDNSRSSQHGHVVQEGKPPEKEKKDKKKAPLVAAPAAASSSGAERCKQINAYHTLAVYQYTCRGLFEDHKLLFSLQLCLRIMENEGKVPKAEFDFFMYGGVVVDRAEQRANPAAEWIDALTWDNVTELDALPAFQGLASSFEQGHREWKVWFTSPKPEEAALPGDWENKVSELQRMCIVRALRLDRALFAATRFVSLHLGPQYADPPAFDLKGAYATSTTRTPLIFVLSPGVDPTAQVMALGKDLGVRVDMIALGQGQGPVAMEYVTLGLRDGTWVLLANCHLMLSWLPELEKRITEYASIPEDSPDAPHPSFRLWISASPSPEFPIAILQRGIKMTTEPPRGLRANMMQLYNLVSGEQFNRCGQRFKYRRLLFALCWFHATLLERRKFKSLGFNVPYEFNESDFSICHDLIIVFLDEYPDRTPFEAMRYLIAEANYGGRVTDSWDRRLVNVYIAQFFCEEAISEDAPGGTQPGGSSGFNLAPQQEEPVYVIPNDADLAGAKEAIRNFPQSDAALAFGQHANADISSQIEDSNALLATIVSLQPKLVVQGAETNESKILRQCRAMQEQVPPIFDVAAVKKTMDARSDPEPMKTVLYQELDRYNALLTILHQSLKDLELGVQGLVVVTPELEQVMDSLLDFKVPASWSKCYPSLKPLGLWIRDLGARVASFRSWIDEALPRCFWLPSFTYPTGFLTALLQTSARKNGIAIDTLSWDFPIVNTAASSITQHAKDGSYCSGLFLEGARWDFDAGTLTEPIPMELFCTMPVVHFKPAENKKKMTKGFYSCPLYMYPFRSGSRERPSFVIAVDIKAGTKSADYWTTRGTALLLSTAL